MVQSKLPSRKMRWCFGHETNSDLGCDRTSNQLLCSPAGYNWTTEASSLGPMVSSNNNVTAIHKRLGNTFNIFILMQWKWTLVCQWKRTQVGRSNCVQRFSFFHWVAQIEQFKRNPAWHSWICQICHFRLWIDSERALEWLMSSCENESWLTSSCQEGYKTKCVPEAQMGWHKSFNQNEPWYSERPLKCCALTERP